MRKIILYEESPVKKFFALLLLVLIRSALWFRYKVTVKGLDQINPAILNKPSGVLFLPNHPAIFVDPTLIALAIWKKYKIRPIITEYMYYTPLIHTVMRLMDALPMPNFSSSSNTLKKKRADRLLQTVIDNLKKNDSFLIYPAGKTKQQAREIIGGSAVHNIIQAVPDVNVVLVRTTGLWGSKFSRGLTAGQNPPYMFHTIFWGVKKVFQNLLFFTPRRHVTIEFAPAGPDFPLQGSRLEINRYLENWYNKSGPFAEKNEQEGIEELSLVSYSMWKEELPEVAVKESLETEINLSKISLSIQEKIKNKLSEMTQMPVEQITPDMDLAGNLGLDSLDAADLLSFLDEQFGTTGIPINELTTVGKVMALAAKQISFREEGAEEEEKDISHWNKGVSHKLAKIAPGSTIHEVFLNCCAEMGDRAASGDDRGGIVTYRQAKLRVILLAEYIKKLPGESIGILLPSSTTSYLTILACQLAGKIPVMINWTMGPRHLESVVSLSHIGTVLSSWSFLDKLDNIDLSPVEDLIIMLEDVKQELTIKDKLQAWALSKLSTKQILSRFKTDKKPEESGAVLLFTSGTESQPKGVPLTHKNILNNQRASLEAVELFQDDVLLGILPPFHAFGFTLSGLLPLLSGIRAAYYPDPTNGKGLARSVQKWKASLICGAPAFLKGLFKNALPQQLSTLRIVVTGAEKAPDELFTMVAALKNCHLIEGYGITECSPVITINKKGDPSKGVGHPLANVALSIVNLDTHEPVVQGESGLILIRGPNVFAGYKNQGISSPFIKVGGEPWYNTGDLGFLTSDGALVLSGRLKRFVKIGGEMISLSAIESTLQKIGEKKAVTSGDGSNGEGPSLAVCAKEEAGEKTRIFVFTCFPTSIEELNISLRQAGFSNLVKIYQTEQIEHIPLMGSGKIYYRELEKKIS